MEDVLSKRRVIQNIQSYVEIQKAEIWVPRSELKTAEEEFQRLKQAGKILKAQFRPEWSCKGSVNFLMKYPH